MEKEVFDEILIELKKLETERNITILYANESGSRAWGFPSTDSDYDVRFVYMHSLEWYVNIGSPKDQIDLFITKELDLKGWDLRKALTLMKKTNVSVYEWLQSPITYRNEDDFQAKLLALCPSYYSPKRAFYHYYSSMRNYMNDFGQTMKLKRFFYIVRSLFNSLWLVEKESMPPLVLEDLLPLCKDENAINAIRDLVEFKATVGEGHVGEIPAILLTYVQAEFERLGGLAEGVKSLKVNNDLFNEFLRGQIIGK